MVEEYRKITACRICENTELKVVVSLGDQWVVDFVDDPSKPTRPVAPLTLVRCTRCALVQLSATVNPDLLFRKFWYRSGVSESMRKSLQDIVTRASEVAKLKDGDAVLDIGANDGTMLSMFPESITRVGVDPSDQITTEFAHSNMDIAVHAYFDKDTSSKIYKIAGRGFKLITAIAMFYDLEHPDKFLYDARRILDNDGVIVIQMNYLLEMVKNMAFDNICHEHLTYFSLKTLDYLVKRVGLEIIHAETNSVNGGSIRVYLQRWDPLRERTTLVDDLIREEEEFKINTQERMEQFGKDVLTACEKLGKFLVNLVGGRVDGQIHCMYGYGASTRGTVLLQCLPHQVLSAVAERDDYKIGKYMVGSWKYICTEKEARERSWHMLVLPWHFKEQIIEREREWLNAGGTLIFPLPKPHMVTKDGEKEI